MRKCRVCGREGTKKDLIFVHVKPKGKGGWKFYLCEECFSKLKYELGFK